MDWFSKLLLCLMLCRHINGISNNNKSLPPEKISTKERIEFLKLAYETAIGDLQFFKRQQYIVVNYSILIYAAIISFCQILFNSKIPCFYFSFFLIVSLIALVFSLIILCSLEGAIDNSRRRKDDTLAEIKTINTNLGPLLVAGTPDYFGREFIHPAIIFILIIGFIFELLYLLQKFEYLSL